MSDCCVGMVGSIGMRLPAFKGKPNNWPQDVAYYNGLCVWNNDKTFDGCYEFAPVHTSIQLFCLPPGHAACNKDGTKSFGVHATASIPVGVTIGYYAGEYYHQPSYDEYDTESNCYVMEPFTNSAFVYDGKILSNEMRFINDPRGISPWANVIMGEHEQMNHHSVVARPIVTIREIEAGQEILMDYGVEYWKSRGQNMNYVECCKCSRILDHETHFVKRVVGFSKECKECFMDKPMVACVKCHVEYEQTPEHFYKSSNGNLLKSCKTCHIAETRMRRKASTKKKRKRRFYGKRNDNIDDDHIGDKKRTNDSAEEASDADLGDNDPDVLNPLLIGPPVSQHQIGSLMELIMDSVDYDNYRTSFVPVSIISHAPDDHYVVGGYVGDDLKQWCVSGINLIHPRGPEMIRVFLSMENVEVIDEHGVWWGATIVCSLNANNEYSIIWKASFDEFVTIERVHKRRVRSAHK
jgi:hypothetical protein